MMFFRNKAMALIFSERNSNYTFIDRGTVVPEHQRWAVVVLTST